MSDFIILKHFKTTKKIIVHKLFLDNVKCCILASNGSNEKCALGLIAFEGARH